MPGRCFTRSMIDRDGSSDGGGRPGIAAVRRRSRGGASRPQDGLVNDKVAQVVEDPDRSLWIGYRDAYGITHLTFPGGDQMGDVKMESVHHAGQRSAVR